MTPPRSVGIVGLGLMGGSLALDMAALDDPPTVVGWSREREDLEAALGAGAVTRAASSAAEAAGNADLVVYAVPLGAALDLMEAHRRVWAADAVITDVVSLKAPLVARARELDLSERFVGGHPLAGAEVSGFGAARAGLFSGRPVWLTDDTGGAGARDAVETLWGSVGAAPAWIGAEEHDRRMVWASHLPQLVANALARVLAEEGFTRQDLGPGGLDMTRLAASSPGMWEDLLTSSAPRAAGAAARAAAALGEISRALEEGRIGALAALMDDTRRWRAGDPMPPDTPPVGGGDVP